MGNKVKMETSVSVLVWGKLHCGLLVSWLQTRTSASCSRPLSASSLLSLITLPSGKVRLSLSFSLRLHSGLLRLRPLPSDGLGPA